jgi:ABC-type uncharacterized transport system substrate-binding protein
MALAGLATTPIATVLVGPALAHPHVFPLVKVTALFDGAGRFSGVHEKWTFDYDYSAIAKELADTDDSKSIDDEEMARSWTEGLAWVAHHDYFTRLTVAGRPVPHGEPQDVNPRFFAGKLLVEFTLPLAEPQPVTLGAGIDVFDGEFYYDFEFDYPDVDATNAPAACMVDRRQQANLDPVAVMLIRKLGLPADPSILNDPAAGYAVRVAIDCGGIASAITGFGVPSPSAPLPSRRQDSFTDN